MCFFLMDFERVRVGGSGVDWIRRGESGILRGCLFIYCLFRDVCGREKDVVK